MYTNIRTCVNLKDGIQNKETVKIRFPLGHLTRTVGQAPLVPTVTPPVVLCSVVARVCGGLAHAPHCLMMVAERSSQHSQLLPSLPA